MGERPVVLVVEDDDCVGDLLRHVLEDEGFAVQLAVEAGTALEAARRLRPELVLLDVRLPGPDGWTVLGELRRQAGTRETPVVMMSALFPEHQRAPRELHAEVSAYLPKPFSVRRLVHTVKDALTAPCSGRPC